MRISVIIPTYNRSSMILEALESVFAQTRLADEILVIDDGSTDGTGDLLKGLGDKITYIYKKNNGVNKARNTGIEQSTGDWITFLDDDDLWMPHRLAVLERDINANPQTAESHMANLIFTGKDHSGKDYVWNQFDIKGMSYPLGEARLTRKPLQYAIDGMQINAFACTPHAARSVGMFNGGMYSCEDALFCSKLALHGPWLLTSDVVSEVRRVESGSRSITFKSSQDPLRRLKDRLFVCTKLEEMPMDREEKWIVRNRRAFVTLCLARAQKAAGDSGAARRSLIKAASLHPTPWKGWIKSLLPLFLGERGFKIVFDRVKPYVRN